MTPWVCPKCGRVWNGIVMECRPCNLRVAPVRLGPLFRPWRERRPHPG